VKKIRQSSSVHDILHGRLSTRPSAILTAWFAARETATALLKSAQLLGLSEDQFEELRKVAAEVAYD
jgi:hypothetical protein